jgi:hypothetical protein
MNPKGCNEHGRRILAENIKDVKCPDPSVVIDSVFSKVTS